MIRVPDLTLLLLLPINLIIAHFALTEFLQAIIAIIFLIHPNPHISFSIPLSLIVNYCFI